MQRNKVFNPSLVFGRCVVEVGSWWANKSAAQKYARFLAQGLTVWSTIDIVAMMTIAFISLFVQIPVTALLLFGFFALGCPLIMTLGIGCGCLTQLTAKETWTIVRDYFLEK